MILYTAMQLLDTDEQGRSQGVKTPTSLEDILNLLVLKNFLTTQKF